MGRFKSFDYTAQSVVRMPGGPTEANKKHRGFALNCEPRTADLYLYLKRHKEEMKTYYVTGNTLKRVEGMPVKEVTPEMAMYICRKPSCGMVLHAQDDDCRLSYLFANTPNGIYMEMFEGRVRVTDSESQILKHFVGTIVVNDGEIDMRPSSTLQMLISKAYSKEFGIRIDPYYIHDGMKLLKSLPEEYQHQGIDLGKILGDDDLLKSMPFLKSRAEDHFMKLKMLETAFKSYLFIHCSNVDYCEYVADEDASSGGNGRGNNDYILVDAFWDKEINVINPFKVSGHFRKQPCGKGRKERRLIYIEEFLKKGYHRQATKTTLDI